NNACTVAACDPTNGPVQNPVLVNDNDLCTTDACDPVTGVSHTPVNINDNDACTTDACNPATGVSHTPVDIDDNNACTADACDPAIGVSHTNLPAGTGCGNGNQCNDMGQCVGCTTAADCPGQVTECGAPVCNAGVCGLTFAPPGTALSTQMPGDCAASVCDGTGGTTTAIDNTDLPGDDGNQCTLEACNNGMPSHPPQTAGTPCNQNGGTQCDAAGICVGPGPVAPTVTATTPADGALDVPVGSTIAVTFSTAMNPATLTAATDTGACTGSIQISTDDFATCLGFAAAAPTMSMGNTVATLVPAPALSYFSAYKIRVTTGAQNGAGTPLAAAYTTPDGFLTAEPTNSCVGSVVISQAYGGGGNSGAQYTHDFVELHNRGATPVNITGWSLQYTSAAGTAWNTNLLTLNGTIPAGGYFLVQLATGGAAGAALPTPNQTGSLNLSGTAGKLALVSNTTALSGACPLGGAVVDFIGFGPTANCSETAVAPVLSNTQSAHRSGAGCTDTGNNSVDFTAAAPAPRNAASAVLVCGCPIVGTVNESADPTEIDYCNVQFPASATVAAGQMSPMIYGRVFDAGFTEAAGANAAIVAELGFGPANKNPTTQSGYTFVPATFNIQVGNDDEYQASFTAPATPGSYRYVYRFSHNAGSSWTYCDLNGAGSNAGLTFEVTEMPVLSVIP
ncbi:MAG TPA: lamin tail domain-containing protein, partial [Polyangium sp.]|nr:lamin tail domain-containing protein [Polyangium sp.]